MPSHQQKHFQRNSHRVTFLCEMQNIIVIDLGESLSNDFLFTMAQYFSMYLDR